MRLPLDQTKITAVVTGEARPVLIYGTSVARTDKDGRTLYRISVLLLGTSDMVDPSTTVTLPGPIHSFAKGQTVRFSNLTLATWTMRDAGGKERHGVTLRADGFEIDVKPSR